MNMFPIMFTTAFQSCLRLLVCFQTPSKFGIPNRAFFYSGLRKSWPNSWSEFDKSPTNESRFWTFLTAAECPNLIDSLRVAVVAFSKKKYLFASHFYFSGNRGFAHLAWIKSAEASNWINFGILSWGVAVIASHTVDFFIVERLF